MACPYGTKEALTSRTFPIFALFGAALLGPARFTHGLAPGMT
jgi:hypothetical protein